MEKYIEKLAVVLLRVYDWLVRIPNDKLLHIVVSSAMTAVLNLFLPLTAVFLIMSLVFLSKETWDKVSGKGTPEWADIFADYIGFVIGIL